MAATTTAFGVYARVDWPWCLAGWIGLVPWLATLDRARTTGGALANGLGMAVAFSLGVFWWFGAAIADYASLPRALGWLALALGGPLLQPQIPVFAVVRHLARGPGRAVVAASAWVATEWAVPKLFGDTLGHGQHPSLYVRQLADVGGVGGITIAVLLANEAAAAMWRAGWSRRLLRPALGFGLAVGLPVIYGAWRVEQIVATERPMRVALVQANIGNYDRLRALEGTFAATRAILERHFALSADALEDAPVDLVVWSETAYPTTFGAPKSPEGAAFDGEIGAFIGRVGAPFVLGAYDADGGGEYNAAFVVEPAGDGKVMFDAYRKASLFPLIEYTPRWLDGPRVRAWLPWLGTWAPGDTPPVIAVTLPGGRALRIAPLVCYDAVDPALARRAARDGAEVFVTLSNDGWFSDGRGPRLHLVVSAFRSVETRRAQVRVTNTGISAVVDPLGTLGAVIPTGVARSRVAEVVPSRSALPLATRWGSWLGPLAACVALGGLILARRPGWRPDAVAVTAGVETT